jgi:hypothetical protein
MLEFGEKNRGDGGERKCIGGVVCPTSGSHAQQTVKKKNLLQVRSLAKWRQAHRTRAVPTGKPAARAPLMKPTKRLANHEPQ